MCLGSILRTKPEGKNILLRLALSNDIFTLSWSYDLLL